MDPFKLRVKLGQNEFEAEGPEQTVAEQFQVFLSAFNKIEEKAIEENSSDTQDGPAVSERLKRKLRWLEIPMKELEFVFSRPEPFIYKLKYLPPTDDQQFDSLILLIYGIQAITNLTHEDPPPRHPGSFGIVPEDYPATATQLIKSAEVSGLGIDRIDRLIFSGKGGNYVSRGGAKKGSVYYLTKSGREHAVGLLRKMLAEEPFDP